MQIKLVVVGKLVYDNITRYGGVPAYAVVRFRIRHPGIWPGKLSLKESSFRGDANIEFRAARTSNVSPVTSFLGEAEITKKIDQNF